MTTERTHLSIGEVLSLLQPEFPDITISKIRFLESQGLLDPERTPSGYRKFHDDDIERLRWILTQQRDHFLPLKVIKDRLASGDLGNGTPEGVLPLAADPTDDAEAPAVVPAWASTATGPAPEAPAGSPDAAPAAPVVSETGSTAADESTPASTTRRGSASTSAPSEPSEETTADPAPTPTSGGGGNGRGTRDGGSTADGAAPAGDNGSSSSDASAPVTTEAVEDGEPGKDHDRAAAVGRLVEAPDDVTSDDVTPDAAEVEAATSADVDATAAPAGPKGRRRHPTGHQPGAPTPSAAPGSDAETDAVVVALTVEELIERSGLSAREVGELERYGLIAGETDGQVTTYDEESLVIARLAAGFNRFGIEPRHLRMYKVAAEREAGLFEQLISPLLKQRRPSARLQAVEMLEELAELADDLRAAMVRSALREYLGGS
jgi:DNA-binding transcriptional MerR regulator